MREDVLSTDRLTKRFGGLTAVNEVSIDLRRNHIHAVIGPNGAGKSTLANLLSANRRKIGILRRSLRPQ